MLIQMLYSLDGNKYTFEMTNTSAHYECGSQKVAAIPYGLEYTRTMVQGRLRI